MNSNLLVLSFSHFFTAKVLDGWVVEQFLQDEVEGFYEATAANPGLVYNSADVKLVYSSASEGEGWWPFSTFAFSSSANKTPTWNGFKHFVL